MDVDFQEIGKRIARRRKALGFKQAEICERCGISDKYLSNIECARSVPSVDMLMRICEELKTTPDAILLGVHRESNGDLEQEIASYLRGLNARQLALIKGFVGWVSEQQI